MSNVLPPQVAQLFDQTVDESNTGVPCRGTTFNRAAIACMGLIGAIDRAESAGISLGPSREQLTIIGRA